MRRLSLFFFLGLLGASHAAIAPVSMPSDRPIRVLLLFPSDLLIPWALSQAQLSKSAISAAVSGDIDFFAEGQDVLRMRGPDSEAEFVALLRKRYESLTPDLIVFHGPMAGFAQRQRETLWSGTPRMAVSAIAGMPSSAYPDDIPGTSVKYDIAGTVDLATRLQPGSRRLLVMGGGGAAFSDEELALAQRQLAPFQDRLTIDYLTHGSAQEREQALAAVPRDTILLHLAVMRPAKGKLLVPSALGRQLMAAANAPSYSHYDVVVGMGSVGGLVVNWDSQKEQIGKIAAALLRGGGAQVPTGLQAPVASVCRVDWQQLSRWKLPLAKLPKNCEVMFQPVPFWREYRREVTMIGIALLFQSFLIVALLLQRRRRQVVELELLNQRTQLMHAARLATVGELSASIAHEVNQPLAAILSNAEAGEQLTRSGKPTLEQLREIFVSIRDDDQRASEVVQRMRRLLRQEANEFRSIDVNEAVESIARLTRKLARQNGVDVRVELDRNLPKVNGDFVQIQQVLLNLLVNALEAMEKSPAEERRVIITTAMRAPKQVEITIADSGPGISTETLRQVFQPFYTTKPNGMGLGLSITRTIVHAHNGQIQAESNGTGAVFRVTLPALS